MNGPVCALAGVGHAFGDVPVFEGVSLSVEPGTVTALVGPNGSGKTTLLRLAAGLLDPDSGTVERTPARGRPVGYLPQSPAFREGFTVRETLAFYARLVDDGADPTDLLDRVGLADAVDRRVSALSGGTTRLLGVAAATAGDPPLYVLDEPSSGLDPAATRRVFGAVESLADGGAGVLLATHDLAAAERAADDALLLDDGVLARGSPPALRERTGAATLADAFATLVDGEGRP